MIINGLSIPVFLRIRKGITPYGGRRVELSHVRPDESVVVSVPGREAPAIYHRDEVEGLNGRPLQTIAEISAARPWSKEGMPTD
jgi:hypothetical protein